MRLKLFLFLVTLVIPVLVYAGCSEVPEAIRKSYASNFHHAFLLQSQGKSTAAICQFQSAYETAKKAGESIQRLKIVEQLFGWLGGSLGAILGGGALFTDGCIRMGLVLNNLWAQHERAIMDLKKWEESAKKTINSN